PLVLPRLPRCVLLARWVSRRICTPMPRTTAVHPARAESTRKSRPYASTPQSRKPTYPAALRFAQLVHELHARPRGVSFRELRSVLGGVSERTVRRYAASLSRELVDRQDRPIL